MMKSEQIGEDKELLSPNELNHEEKNKKESINDKQQINSEEKNQIKSYQKNEDINPLNNSEEDLQRDKTDLMLKNNLEDINIQLSPKETNIIGNSLISPIRNNTIQSKGSAFAPLQDFSKIYMYSPSMKVAMGRENANINNNYEESPDKGNNQFNSQTQNGQNIYKIIANDRVSNYQNNPGSPNNQNCSNEINNSIPLKLNSKDSLGISPNHEGENTKNNSKFFSNNTEKGGQNSSNNNSSNNQMKLICTCAKTNCKKKYCACYANGRYCDGCQCVNCENKEDTTKYINCISNEQNITIICTCTKSNCKKKYCECFKNNKECTWMCRCVNCANCSVKSCNNDDLIIEGIGIEIYKNIIYIKRRIIYDKSKGIFNQVVYKDENDQIIYDDDYNKPNLNIQSGNNMTINVENSNNNGNDYINNTNNNCSSQNNYNDFLSNKKTNNTSFNNILNNNINNNIINNNIFPTIIGNESNNDIPESVLEEIKAEIHSQKLMSAQKRNRTDDEDYQKEMNCNILNQNDVFHK